MKQILIIFFIILIGLSHPFFVFGQTTTPQPTCAPVPTGSFLSTGSIPGINCGIVGDVCGNNKCCTSKSEMEAPQLYIPFITDFLTLLKIQHPLDKLKIIQKSVILQPCIAGSPTTPGDPNNPNCICVIPTDTPLEAIKPMCENIKTNEKQKCLDCFDGKGGSVGIWTSMGCLRGSVGGFIQETVFGWGVGLAGGFALLCIIYSAYMMQASGGNAEKIKKAQEMLTSCIMGLMLIIFSVLILRIIGVNILRIPGFL